ncbi:hypothetical protein V6N11_064913 [Hibiscus sabdariffa]|uniref:Uncharacterized protein n=2 Tax=Hibiscus sabdariffa TaxID=183260 RepID=A0ABR1ZEG2_9ROSI
MVKLSRAATVVPTNLPPTEDANHTSYTMEPMLPARCMEQDVPLPNIPSDTSPATTSAPHSMSSSTHNTSQATQTITAISSILAAPSTNPACINFNTFDSSYILSALKKKKTNKQNQENVEIKEP